MGACLRPIVEGQGFGAGYLWEWIEVVEAAMEGRRRVLGWYRCSCGGGGGGGPGVPWRLRVKREETVSGVREAWKPWRVAVWLSVRGTAFGLGGGGGIAVCTPCTQVLVLQGSWSDAGGRPAGQRATALVGGWISGHELDPQ